MYNDLFYGADLEVRAFGTFSIQITDAERFVRNFLPANVSYYTFDSLQARSQIVTEFLQSLFVALNSSIYYLPNFTITITSNSSSKPSSL